METNRPDRKLPRGMELLHSPRLNKLTAFTEAEREALGLIGLVPEGLDTEEMQLQRVHLQLGQKTTDLERYVFLNSLQDNDETLFYKAIMSDPALFMPLVYTPTHVRSSATFSGDPRDFTSQSGARAGSARSWATGRIRR
jgi:malate dehydrogenase (oxaloacetate-decarboxylating)(NADP+)